MHYTRDYTSMPLPDKREAALEDVQFYLGGDRYAELTAMFRHQSPPLTFDSFAMCCSLAGIEGYPVRAWYETIWPEWQAKERQ